MERPALRSGALTARRAQGVAPLSADAVPSAVTLVVATAIVLSNAVLFMLLAADVLDGAGLISHDEEVLAWFVDHRTEWMITTAKVIGTLTSFLSLLIVGLLLGLWLWRRGTHFLLAAAPAVSLSLAGLASTIAKAYFDRERPNISLHATEVTLASFPSGHSVDAAGFFLAAALALALTVAHTHSVQVLLIGAGLLCAAVVGVSRLILAVHWLSDVVAGWTLGTAVAITVVTACWSISARLCRDVASATSAVDIHEMGDRSAERPRHDSNL